MNTLKDFFAKTPAFVGMVHLPALPGSPNWGGSMQQVIDEACRDANIIEAGGADGIMIENFWDAPFTKGRVEAHTVAALTVCVHEIMKNVSIPVGVNVLRNDALSALSIATVTGADYIRVNVLTHAMVTDQGIIEGASYELSRLRALLQSPVKVFADVMVKHAYPLGDMDIETAAKDIAHRGGADALIVSGSGTGSPINREDLSRVRKAVPDIPIASGSGITIDNIDEFKPFLDIIIVGTSIKKNGLVENPVDLGSVEQLAAKIRK